MNPEIVRRPVAQRLREWLIARCLAPINLDGSQVQDITIDGQSVSQVTMDGDEVFGDVIPDSAASQYRIDEGSEPSLTNEFSGQPDATINGASWFSDPDLVGGNGLSFDGADDLVTIDSNYGFIGNGEQFSTAFTVNMDDLAEDQIIWQQSNGNYEFAIGTPNGGSIGPGFLGATYYDGSTRAAEQMASAATTSRLRLGIAFDAVAESVSVFINGSDQGDTSGGTSIAVESGNVLGGQADNERNTGMDLDNPIWFDAVLSAAEFQQDYENQPWA